jgi:transposase InsO family protein
MDICGPYETTARRNRYILTIVDQLTKYAEAVPIRDCSARSCAKAYAENVIARHGIGGTIVTDRGVGFMSSFFNETCKILGVKHVNTTSYHPKSNGSAEKFHLTLNRGLSYYVNSKGSDWDNLLALYLMSYNGCPHSTTSYSPYYLLHGRELVLPST